MVIYAVPLVACRLQWLPGFGVNQLVCKHSPATLQAVVKLLEGQHKPEMDNIWLQTKVDVLKGQQVG